MELKILPKKVKNLVEKYRYAVLVLLIGLVLLMLPGRNEEKTETGPLPSAEQQTTEQEALAKILGQIAGAGKVEVLLSVRAGEETLYQTDESESTSGDGGSTRVETVLVTDADRNETGLIRQINPPVYLGAVVVCEGADSPSVRLAMIEAVGKLTGLSSDKICVLKMK